MARIKRARDINFRYNFGVYWSFLKKYKLLFAFIMFLVLVNAVTHLVDKLLFKRIIDDGTLFIEGALGENVFVEVLVIVAIVYMGTLIVRTLAKWAQVHFMNHLDSRLIIDMKRRFFNHILGLSHNFHTTHKTGSLISRLVRGSGSMERLTDFFIFNTAPLVFQLILVGVSLLYFDVISAIVVAVTAVVFIVYSFFLQQAQRETNIEYNNEEDFEKGNIGDFFTNIDSIKYFGKEKAIIGRYETLSSFTKKSQIKFWHYYRWLSGGQSFILGLGTFFVLLFPLIRLLNGDMTIGTVVFIYTVYGNLMGPLFGFVSGMRGFYKSMADFESLFQYAKIKNEIKDKKKAQDLKIEKGEINFDNVHFGYGRRGLLRGFDLKIKKNEKVAFVGHSGCGKTTLVKLLYRLFDVDKGKILIDGKDIKDFKQESLRSELSIVPQECVLFDDTIYNNIAFSNADATKEEVFAAMKFAQLDKFIAKLPKKEKTIVGERGVKLSGGEKQRVSIARAILADKKILLLDEATSALDSRTEHEIQKDLFRLMEGRTSIIIAHRLSTIMRADKIVVMDEGKIIQMGKHRDLVKKKGMYKELWELQKGGFIEE